MGTKKKERVPYLFPVETILSDESEAKKDRPAEGTVERRIKLEMRRGGAKNIYIDIHTIK